jgi:transcription initiation factor TFIID TATA-box-binding protein
MERGGANAGAAAASGRDACHIRLYNVTCTVNLGTQLDLKTIHQKTRNSEYNPRRFCAVIIRLRKPKTTALVFSTGKLVCTGATSPAQVKEAARRFAWMIKKLGFQNVKFRDFTIQNMLGTTYVGFPIRLEGLSLHHVEFCSYEPEIFAGLVYKMLAPKICLLIFVSGRVVLTGGKSVQDLEDALTNIYPVLQEFQKKP